MIDYLIVGTGLSGATAARLLTDAGKKVVVVEDTSTTGGSPLTAAEALERAGAIIVAVATVVDRDTGAQKVIEDAGYRYLTAVTLDDLGLR